ncbi:MAG: AraC family transcriptional regulator [Treponemataceae bacterium]|nr:MAG: AraC family transcriptional regulator [Treponemataceae bacterium]
MDTNAKQMHYISHSDEDAKLGMLCTTAGDILVPPRTEYPPNKIEHPPVFRPVAEGRTLPEFQLVFIGEGEGIFQTDGNTYDVSSGTLMLILPGVPHFYKPLYESGWHEYWVGFCGRYFDALMEQGFLTKSHVVFDVGSKEYVMGTFNRIFEELSMQRPLYQLKVCSGVFSLIAEVLASSRRREQPNFYESVVEKAKYLMESNIYGTINVSDIAQKIGMSASRLSDIFKTYTSMTPYHYYIQIKIRKAQTMLEEEDISVKETAFRLGFDDQYYFSRLFKSKTGVAPSDWKNYIYGGSSKI